MAKLTVIDLNQAVDFDDLDLNWYMRFLDYAELEQGYNASLAGRIYPDVAYVEASTGTEALTLAVGGINLTANDNGLTGGRITGIIEFDTNSGQIVYLIQDIDISAVAFQSALNTASSADERSLLQIALQGADTISLSNMGDRAYGFAGNDQIFGKGGADWIDGGSGNDDIRGDDGADKLYGGTGDDSLIGDFLSADGTFGPAGDDELYGQDGDDVLMGGPGNDLLDGGSGTRDFASFYAAPAGVTVDLSNTGWQNTGEGSDRLVGIEGLIGSKYNDVLTGDGQDNDFQAHDGADTLDGGGGTDKLYGGKGNDTYLIKVQSGTTITEYAGEGQDKVISRISTYTLPDHVEVLVLEGLMALKGIGNSLANELFGNEFNNELQGLDGDDLLDGGAGDDLLLGGTGFDKLLGGDGNDTLDGGVGADTMIGGEGNDTYYIDAPGDSATEVVGTGGTDTIITNQTTDLGEAFEILYLTGNANLNGTGGSQNNALTGNAGDNLLRGLGGDDGIVGGAGGDTLDGGAGDDVLDGGVGVDTALFTGNRSLYTISQTATGKFTVTGPDGTDKLSNVEFLQFADQKVKLYPGTGTNVNFATDDPATYMTAIRDFDGNDVGAAADWKRIGSADVNGDGDVDQIFVNRTNGRFAEVGTAPDGKVYFSDHGWAGESRVVGIYIDPLVQSGDVVAGGPNDSQRRFQNDLFIGNIKGVLGAGDYDKDGLQEVYFALTDGTAFLHAYMHADGNIRYANYQSQQQVIGFLSQNGWASSTYDGWFS
jgi:Ca2+-binding RTX toxin-like protein